MEQKKAERKRIWTCVLVIGVILIVWGVVGLGFGFYNYSSAKVDEQLAAETAELVMQSAKGMLVKGIVRVLIGVVAVVLGKIRGGRNKETR